MRFSYNFKEPLKGIGFFFYAAFVLCLIVIIQNYFHNFFIDLIAVTITILFLIFAFFIGKDINHFDKGIDGENDVTDVLRQFPNYKFLHDVVLGDNKWNIDFVVIGQNGIWALEVKNHKDTAIINDKFLIEDLKQPKGEALAIHDFIQQTCNVDIYVQPVMVYTNKKTRLNFGFNKQDGVYVIGIKFLPELFSQHSETQLAVEQCNQIYEGLKKYTSIA